jgi:hypothetical protein
VIGEDGRLSERRSSREREGERGDDGVAGAGDIGDLAGDGGDRPFDILRGQPHAVLAAGNQRRVAARALAEDHGRRLEPLRLSGSDGAWRLQPRDGWG